MGELAFSLSTFFFHQQRLDREHLVDVAAHGFGAIELFALPSHFACADAQSVAQLQEWLDDTRLSLSSVYAVMADGLEDGRWVRPCAITSTDPATRERAVARATEALDLARVLPYRHLILDVGVPDAGAGAADNDAAAAARSLEGLARHAEECGVDIALHLQPNRLSTAEALVSLIEEVLDVSNVGICMDVGHARLLGDPVDAIEATSGHILSAHVHDTHGSRVEHLVPYDGSVDWTRTLMAFQKVGFTGPWVFELAPTSTPIATLTAAAEARQRFLQRLGINDELLSQ